MNSSDKAFLAVTKNILNAILLIIPVFIAVIIVTSVVFLGIFSFDEYEVLLVPVSFLLSIGSIFYFNRHSILRFAFYDDYILVQYLVMPARALKIYYSYISSIDWKVNYTYRDQQSEYLLILHLKGETLEKESYHPSLGLKYMSRERWTDVRPEYSPILDPYDIAAFKKHLSKKIPFHMNTINSIDLKKIERLEK